MDPESLQNDEPDPYATKQACENRRSQQIYDQSGENVRISPRFQ